MTINNTTTMMMHVYTSSGKVTFSSFHSALIPFKYHNGRQSGLEAACYQHRKNNPFIYTIYMRSTFSSLGTPPDELRGLYISCILPKLMYDSPGWSSSLNITQINDSRVQKRTCKEIMVSSLTDYDNTVRVPPTDADFSAIAEWHKNTHMLPITLPRAGNLH